MFEPRVDRLTRRDAKWRVRDVPNSKLSRGRDWRDSVRSCPTPSGIDGNVSPWKSTESLAGGPPRALARRCNSYHRRVERLSAHRAKIRSVVSKHSTVGSHQVVARTGSSRRDSDHWCLELHTAR